MGSATDKPDAAVTTGRRHPRYFLWLLSMLLIGIVLAAFLSVSFRVRSWVRWTVSSQAYKSAVLAEPSPQAGEFKHIEWDGWGGLGAGDTVAYLVFDPTNSLASAVEKRQSGKFSGIPCSVSSVRRLESQWYTVVFYTDEQWGRPNHDCY